MKLFTLFILCLFGITSFCQTALDSDAVLQKKLQSREAAEEFFYTLQVVSPLTTLSAFTEGNKIWPSLFQKKMFILHGVLQTPIPIGGRWFKTSGLRFSLFIHPDVEVRIFQNDKSQGDSSHPVRTPSFKPGATFYITAKRLWDNRRTQHYFGFKAYHHSNGQDGSHFRTTDGGYFNRINGDFSDDVCFEFIYGGFFNGKVFKDTFAKSRYFVHQYATHNLYWRGAFELRAPKLITGGLNELNIYGRYRTNFQVGYIFSPFYKERVSSKQNTWIDMEERQKERVRLYAEISYIWDANYFSGPIQNLKRVPLYDITKRLNVVVTASYRIWGTPFVGLFLQGGYYGSDPYNVYFQQQNLFIRAGISSGFMIYRSVDKTRKFKSKIDQLYLKDLNH